MDLVGLNVGKLTVLEKTSKPEHLKTKGSYWLAQCECGNQTIVCASCLKGKHPTSSCGCLKSSNLVGRKFGRGEVLSLTNLDKRSNKVWLLKCSCGVLYKANTNSLTSGNTTSCGCSRKGKDSSNYKGHEDISGDNWTDIQRNAKIRDIGFDITIEDAWKKFLDQNKKCALTSWDITLFASSRKSRTEEQTASLDRINSQLGYTVSNIQWIHKDLNRMKTDFDQDYFLKMCKAVSRKK